MIMYDIAVIGAGPAGIAASIYLKRAGYKAVLFERETVGGLLRNANHVENYPGFPEGINGQEITKLFRQQLITHGISVTKANVERVSKIPGGYLLQCPRTRFIARCVIVSTGTIPRKISLRGLSGLPANIVNYDIVHMPIKLKGKCILIIGGSDASFDYALTCSERNAYVIILHRLQKPKCLKLLETRVRLNKKIKVLKNCEPISVIRKQKGIALTFLNGYEKKNIEADYLLIACGREPNISILSRDIKHKISNGSDISGLYICGDARGGFRQSGIAVGDGLRIAMTVCKYLEDLY